MNNKEETITSYTFIVPVSSTLDTLITNKDRDLISKHTIKLTLEKMLGNLNQIISEIENIK